MVEVFPLERSIGMELYSTDTKGIEGTIKTRFEDFIVEMGHSLSNVDWMTTNNGKLHTYMDN